MPTNPNKNPACNNCGLLKSTCENAYVRCRGNALDGYMEHDFGQPDVIGHIGHQVSKRMKKECCIVPNCNKIIGHDGYYCEAHHSKYYFGKTDNPCPQDIQDEVSLCNTCHCMTHTIKGKCGKCGWEKKSYCQCMTCQGKRGQEERCDDCQFEGGEHQTDCKHYVPTKWDVEKSKRVPIINSLGMKILKKLQ